MSPNGWPKKDITYLPPNNKYRIDHQMHLQEHDERLSGLETIFHAPPFTNEMVRAIRLIAPQFDLTPDDQSRKFWEVDQNATCWGEYEALEALFSSMPKPQKVLEIGPGLGRSLVFFTRKLGWENCELHAYEGTGKSTKYRLMGPRFEDSFCGNLELLQEVLEYNQMNNVTIHDAYQAPLDTLPGPFDFIYSFYSIGFHWALEHFLEDILSLMNDHSIAVFIVPPSFTPFSALHEIQHRIIEWKTAWPKDAYLKMLVIGKSGLPDF